LFNISWKIDNVMIPVNTLYEVFFEQNELSNNCKTTY
jgi:hypothetical protein